MQNKIKELGMEDVEILATVHDSIEVQCDKENTEVVAKLIKDVMEDISYLKTKYNMDFKVPMKVDVEVGDSFGSVEEVHFDSNRQPTNVADLI
jgi:DNA polymerase I-like protein with 3'-5' exonuclease and polymerase domains